MAGSSEKKIPFTTGQKILGEGGGGVGARIRHQSLRHVFLPGITHNHSSTVISFYGLARQNFVSCFRRNGLTSESKIKPAERRLRPEINLILIDSDKKEIL